MTATAPLPAPVSFDLCGRLPTGTTVLEASAGTGKTYTIAALATRYVAEGVCDLGRMMLVTFGNKASRELRDRVREHLVAAEAALRDPLAARGAGGVVGLLADADDAEIGLRRTRLAVALAGFDAATIATTHSFCQRMLADLGLLADADPDAMLTEATEDLVREIAADLYLRKYGLDTSPPAALEDGMLLEIARRATGSDRSAELWPVDAQALAATRRSAAQAARMLLAQRKRDLGLVDYEDWLVLLRDALADPGRGETACERMRARYDIVLVDEFQDTDPVQWEVLRRAFHGHRTLVLIGDPKQAIYAFRGGDVHTYLEAAEVVDGHATLSTNWRSDRPLLQALQHLFGEAALGDEHIVVRPVGDAHAHARLTDAGTALRLRQVRRRPGLGRLNGDAQLPSVGAIRPVIARDVAADIALLIAGEARLDLGGGPRRVRAGDVAVLTRTNNQGALVRDALTHAGVPAVLSGGGSVFGTAAATAWRVLLDAMEQPHRPGKVRAASLSDFFGRTEAELDAAGDAIVDTDSTRLRVWAALLAEHGVAAFFETLNSETGLPARLLSRPGGERLITDIRHIAEVLHRTVRDEALGLPALAEWLRRRIAQAREEGVDERTRRLESDAAAVQIMTVHVSKGLEFPVVYVPFGWDRYPGPDRPETLRLHAPDGQRVLDVGGSDAPGYAEAKKLADTEDSDEELRLLYVALTRAQCQVVAHWAPSFNTVTSPLHRLLFGLGGPGQVPQARAAVPSDEAVAERLARIGAAGVSAAAELVEPSSRGVQMPPKPDPGPLEVSTFTRGLDALWRRTSYSALTASAHDAAHAAGAVGSEPDPAGSDLLGKDDEQDVSLDVLEAAPPDAMPSPLAAFPGGTTFGTLVHEILEDTDPATLGERTAEAVARRLGSIEPGALAAGLRPVLDTPLGSLGRTLADFGPRDRLAELNFEFPLAGGDRAPGSAGATLAGIARVLGRHDLGPLSAYPALLADLEPTLLRGYLSGSIDAVLRLDGPAFSVVDYKTNRLGRDPLTAWHYRPEAMAEEMLRAHYVLQALLYCVALHRFLRWRQPGYDPAVHIGPVLYLFVRGMCGPESPTGAGVFEWQPPPAAIVELSDLLAGAP